MSSAIVSTILKSLGCGEEVSPRGTAALRMLGEHVSERIPRFESWRGRGDSFFIHCLNCAFLHSGTTQFFDFAEVVLLHIHTYKHQICLCSFLKRGAA